MCRGCQSGQDGAPRDIAAMGPNARRGERRRLKSRGCIDYNHLGWCWARIAVAMMKFRSEIDGIARADRISVRPNSDFERAFYHIGNFFALMCNEFQPRFGSDQVDSALQEIAWIRGDELFDLDVAVRSKGVHRQDRPLTGTSHYSLRLVWFGEKVANREIQDLTNSVERRQRRQSAAIFNLRQEAF